MPQLFPCLKLIDESEDPNSLISEFQIKGSKSKSHLQLFTEWLIKKNAHVLAIDISKSIYPSESKSPIDQLIIFFFFLFAHSLVVIVDFRGNAYR